MTHLSLVDLEARYGEQRVVQALNLDVGRGELVSLLGPSGCGKTTTLRMIAGFVTPSGGTIRIAGRAIDLLPAHRRNIGYVFQNYALFPHLSVADNVGFGLKMRFVAPAERQRRVAAALDLVGLADLGGRFPAQLSGGQQQRVALARALVIEPDVLLLDEPLSNLDAALRAEMRSEIRALQRRLEITTVFVTHDQSEALAMSDRIAVMRAGRIEEVATPQALCDRPARSFTAAFLGVRTVLAGAVADEGAAGRVFRTAHGLSLRLADHDPPSPTHLVLRAARLALAEPADESPGDARLDASARVAGVTYAGDAYDIDLESGGERLRAIVPSNAPVPAIGSSCRVFAREDAVTWISDPPAARASAAPLQGG
ncbi:MAG: ABC transporter ATP-binding protein [Alphaproteobacteria bacterium]|nr:ABC transporter ATP-binding protein [Alphaproteobacteria bacterium]